MKKLGFTIAELVVTLSIIGILAVLVAPAMVNLVPDKNKAQVLKYNTLIGNAVEDIFSDETLYHPFSQANVVDDNTEYFLTIDGVNECGGLECVSNDVSDILQTKIGNNSFSNLTIAGNSTDGYVLTLDTNPSKSGNTFNEWFPKEDKGSFQNVDTFIFNLDKYGKVTAGDALTDAYLKNPLNLNDRKNDLESAKKNYASKTY